MKRISEELVKVGQDFMSNLFNANIQHSLGGDLGGCKQIDPADYPEDQLQYVKAYAAGEITSVEACYLYMREKDQPKRHFVIHKTRQTPYDSDSEFVIIGII